MAFDLAELHLAIEAASDLYYVLSDDGAFEFVNRAGIEFFERVLQSTGARDEDAPSPPLQFVGTNSRELDLPLDWLAIHERGRHIALKTGASVTYETSVAIATQVYYYEFTFTPLPRPTAAPSVLVLGRNVTRYRQLAQERYLTTLVSIQQSLMATQQVSSQYDSILHRLGEASGADRVYMLEAHLGETHPHRFSQVAEWCAAGIAPELHKPFWQRIPFFEVLPTLGINLKVGKPVAVLRHELSSVEQDVFEGADIQAVLMLPIMVNDQIWGMIGFDNCREARSWLVAEVSLLQVAAFLISMRVHQLQADQFQQQWIDELSQSNRQFQALVQAFPDLIFRIRSDGTYLEWHAQNPNDLYVPPHELAGRRMQEVLPAPLGWDLYQRVQETLRQNRTSRYEYRLEVPTGEQHFETRIVPLADDQVLMIARNVSDRKSSERLLNRLVEGTASVGGQAFFQALVEHLALALGVRYAAVEEINGGQARVLAFWDGDRPGQPLEYAIQDTPCELVIQHGQYQIVENLQDVFPDDEILKAMNVVSYAGYALTDANQSPIGILCILDDKPFALSSTAESVFKVFAVRTSMELERQRSEIALHQQAQREKAMNRVVQSIRNSLDLNTIFATTVQEVGRLLNVQQVTIFEYHLNQGIWRAIAAYSTTALDSPVSTRVGVEYSDQDCVFAERLKRMETICSNNMQEYGGHSAPEPSAPEAGMVVPLCKGGELWGALCLTRSGHEPWVDNELSIVQTIADQLAIAIQQAELYQQVQDINLMLENQVLERTIKLQQALSFEDLLRRITDRVRDSLDEHTIFQSTVQELVAGLDLQLCNIVLYDGGYGRRTPVALVIQGEYGSVNQQRGPILSTTHYPELYEQLTQGLSVQLCIPLRADHVKPTDEWASVLLCPIADDQGVIGDLLLLRNREFSFSTRELRLVEQVASQCAIAIRQSRLHQAIQTQVAELEVLNRIKDDFLSAVSHELRTPVTNIKVASQMLELVLRRYALDEPRIERYMKVLQSECQQEIDLINDLLDLQQLEAGTRSLNFIEVSLQNWLPRVVQPFLERIREGDRTIVLDIPEDLPLLTTDIASLQRILGELLHNACAYTPPGETIEITAEAVLTEPSPPVLLAQNRIPYRPKAEAIILLSMCNTGMEIPPDDRPRVFDKFYRSIGIERWRYRGTGLGMALVKRLTEHIGGTVELTSDHNQTCFLIELPVAPRNNTRRSLPSSADVAPVSLDAPMTTTTTGEDAPAE